MPTVATPFTSVYGPVQSWRFGRSLLTEAFQALQQTDLVLGPATDGGYYLIGLRRMVPELFKTIAWSTDRVFQQTVDIASSLNLSLATLPTLTDVDRPDDLPVWEQVTAQTIVY